MLYYFLLSSVSDTNSSPGFFPKTLLLLLGVILFYGFLLFLVRSERDSFQDGTSVKEEARFMEKHARESLGEREFARRLFEFEQETSGELENALKLMAASSDPETTMIGFCWLARKGHGAMPASLLLTNLEKHKN